MDKKEKALTEEEDESSSSDSPTDNQQAPEADTETEGGADLTDETKPKEETGEEEVPRKSAKGRIREVVKERNQARDKVKSLSQQLEEAAATPDVEPDQPEYKPQVQPGQEVTPDQYRGDVISTANAIVDIRLSQRDLRDRILNEARDIQNEYPELNPKDERFDEELSDSIAEASSAYMKGALRNNPKASLQKYVDKLMKPYRKSVDNAVGDETANVAKRVADTAVRPTQKRGQDKKFSDLSEKEMEEKLGVVY